MATTLPFGRTGTLTEPAPSPAMPIGSSFSARSDACEGAEEAGGIDAALR
jgi:hypothetical protein